MSRDPLSAREAVLKVESRLGATMAHEGAASARLARTLGRALAGARAAVILEAADLPSVVDLLRMAQRHRAALVVHCLGRDRSADLATVAGLPVLEAVTVQDSVDAAAVARRLAEEAMVPVLVRHLAAAADQIDLPDAASLRAFAGSADDEINAPTAGQQLVFGDRRRRLQRLFDVDRPMSLAEPTDDDERWSAAMGRRLFFEDEIPHLASLACTEWARRTGREAPAPRHRPAAPPPVHGKPTTAVWDSPWPRRQVLEARLRRLRPEIAEIEAPPAQPITRRIALEDRLPLAVRHLGRGDEVWDDVARFWAEHVEPRAGGARPVPDPYLALGASPVWSATFYDQGGTVLPVLDADRCVACGRCWLSCPDASLAPLLVSTGDVLEHAAAGVEGFDSVARRQLRPLARRLESALSAGTSWADALETNRPFAAEGVGAEPADRWLKAAAELPVVVCAGSPRDEVQDLLLLALEPRSCTGCGVCVLECPEDALRLVPRSDAEESAEAAFRVWQELPDTPGAGIDRWARQPEVGAVAGAMLSRTCRTAVAGGAGVDGFGEVGGGARIALCQLVALVEQGIQRRLLAEAEGLKEEADELCRLDRSGPSPQVDAEQLAQTLSAAQRLDDLRRLLIEGRTGAGRSRFGVVAVGNDIVAWCGRFGQHPFGAPLLAWDGAGTSRLAVDLAGGLADAQAEKGVTSPILLLADRVSAAAIDLGTLQRLLFSQRPVWLVVLDDGPETKPAPEPATNPASGPSSALLAAAAVLGLPVVSTSIAAPEHLAASVASLLRAGESLMPAVLRIHAPSPRAGAFQSAETVLRARTALEVGDWPTILHLPDPQAPYRFTGETPEAAARRAADETKAELRSEHERELAALQTEHAARLRGMEDQARETQAAQLKARLMDLAGLGSTGARRPESEPNEGQRPGECSN